MSPMEPSTMEPSTMEMIMSTTTMNIPNDIVIDILIRVPTKSLLRLRWACKYWFDLITRDPDFIKLHLHTTTSSSTTNQDFSVLISNVISGHTGQLLQCSFVNCYNNNNTESSVEITDFTSIQRMFWLSKFGYCNGLLVCPSLTLDDRICIWNPCTEEYKRLPDPPPPTKRQLGGDAILKQKYCTYGIGYDRTIDDYKVIRTAYYYDLFYHKFLALNTLVYTLQTNSWRNIEPCPYRLTALAAVFVNGALYNWVCDHPETKIISFDIAKEKYKEMSKLPESTRGGIVRRRALHVFEGCLCLLLLLSMNDLTETYYTEMWVMKNNYGMNNSEEDSWTMLFKCQNPLYDNHWMKPVRFTKNREIIMLSPQKLILCDPKSNTIRTVGSICKEEHQISQIVVYIESLVSLNSGTYYKGRTEHKQNDEDNDADDVTKTTMEQYLKC